MCLCLWPSDTRQSIRHLPLLGSGGDALCGALKPLTLLSLEPSFSLMERPRVQPSCALKTAAAVLLAVGGRGQTFPVHFKRTAPPLRRLMAPGAPSFQGQILGQVCQETDLGVQEDRRKSSALELFPPLALLPQSHRGFGLVLGFLCV